MKPLLLLVLVALAAPVSAQPRVILRLAQINAITAPTADVWTTLASNDNPSLVEKNPLVRRADGTADPVRTIGLTAGYVALNLTILRLAWSKELDDAKGLRWLATGVVVALNALNWRAAVNNYRLDRRLR